MAAGFVQAALAEKETAANREHLRDLRRRCLAGGLHPRIPALEASSQLAATAEFGHSCASSDREVAKSDGYAIFRYSRPRVDRLSPRAMARAVRAAAETAGLTSATLNDFSSHSLRHGLITTALDDGVDVDDVRRHARHRALQSTLRYREVTDAAATAAASGDRTTGRRTGFARRWRCGDRARVVRRAATAHVRGRSSAVACPWCSAGSIPSGVFDSSPDLSRP